MNVRLMLVIILAMAFGLLTANSIEEKQIYIFIGIMVSIIGIITWVFDLARRKDQ